MTRLAFLLLALVGVIAAQGASNQTEDPVKTEAAEGHRHHHDHDRSDSDERHHHHRHSYGYGPNYYQPHIHDRYVCDLDASVLLVLSRSRGGLHKAHRVRCSDVAAADEDSCTVCCQNAARRDTTLKNEDILGIVTDTDGYEEHKHHHEADKPNGRYKRSGGSGSGEHRRHRLRDSFPNGETFPWKYSAPNWFKNVKCLCCAPRRQFTPQAPTQIGNIQIPVPQYSQPQYTPPQYTPPQYSPPQYTPPQYSPPQYQPPAPVYQQPTYGQPVAQSPPVYQPQYQQPTYDQSTYNQQAAAPPSPPVVPAAAAPISAY